MSREPTSNEAGLARQLSCLRAELAELAFTLERRGRIDAADVAGAVAARLGELADEFFPAAPVSTDGAAETAARVQPLSSMACSRERKVPGDSAVR